MQRIQAIKVPEEANPDHPGIVQAKGSTPFKETARGLYVALITETEDIQGTNSSAGKEPSGIRRTPLAIILVWYEAAEEAEEVKEAVQDLPDQEVKEIDRAVDKADRQDKEDCLVDLTDKVEDRAVDKVDRPDKADRPGKEDCLVDRTDKAEDRADPAAKEEHLLERMDKVDREEHRADKADYQAGLTDKAENPVDLADREDLTEDPAEPVDKADRADYPVETNLKDRVKMVAGLKTHLIKDPSRVKGAANVPGTAFTESKATAKNLSDASTTEMADLLNTNLNAVKEPFGTAKLTLVTMPGQ